MSQVPWSHGVHWRGWRKVDDLGLHRFARRAIMFCICQHKLTGISADHADCRRTRQDQAEDISDLRTLWCSGMVKRRYSRPYRKIFGRTGTATGRVTRRFCRNSPKYLLDTISFLHDRLGGRQKAQTGKRAPDEMEDHACRQGYF